MNKIADVPHHGPWHGRIEDDPLVRGRGRFSDDVRPDGAAYACFVRSPHAFAEIRKVDAAAARQAAGVLAVLTAADLASAEFATVSAPVPMPGRGGVMVKWPHRPVLAGDRALHVGEPVVLVVAETPEAAQDAAEMVVVDYNPLPAVTDARAALAQGAPQLWPNLPGNLGFDWSAPADADGKMTTEIERAFAECRACRQSRPVQPTPRRGLHGAARSRPRAMTRRATSTPCIAPARAPRRCARK